jgi:hypothetical protein
MPQQQDLPRVERIVPAVTFAVHAVEPESALLEEVKIHEALPELVGGKVEALCDHTTNVVAGVKGHPLVDAVHLAWCAHRPLVFSPDMIWQTILQGFAQHIKNNPERFRDRIVSFQGKETLAVFHPDLVNGSPENPWPEVIEQFCTQVNTSLIANLSWLRADFSTTRKNERVAANIALLDALQPFYEYRVYAACGIPSISLEGTVADWQRLCEKIEHLAEYDLEWWLRYLRVVTHQFLRAAGGDVDLNHWRNLYKRLDLYGGYLISGWIAFLIPYLKDYITGQFTVKNDLMEQPFTPYNSAPAVPQRNVNSNRFAPSEPGLWPRSLPTGVSAAPFTFVINNQERVMEFLGGFFGITQHSETLALRPFLGWAVRQRSAFAQLLIQLRQHAANEPLAPSNLHATLDNLECCTGATSSIPADFLGFYNTYDGLQLFAHEGGPVYRILPGAEWSCLQPPGVLKQRRSSGQWRERKQEWLRFAELNDGTCLAMDFGYQVARGAEEEQPSWERMREQEVFRIIHCREKESDPSHAYRVVAWSFGEFLSLAVNGGARFYWTQPNFEDRGDAFSEATFEGEFPKERTRFMRPE